MRFKGLTWDHPRGYNALAAARQAGGPIDWDVQPLEGFESAPIADLCARYDLLVLDHPHLGEALAADCLQPLSNLFSKDELENIARRAVGPAYESYAMQGQQWALPLDAAAQVMALRPDLTQERPNTWDEVLELSKTGKVALSMAGPHAFLSLLSISCAIDPSLSMGDGGWPESNTLAQAAEILAELAANSPASVEDKNPIGILQHMSENEDVVLVPLIYGYVNYSAPTCATPLHFCNAPRIATGAPGSIIGGTGIAISKRVLLTENLHAHLLWLLSDDVQTDFITTHEGQPSVKSAWLDEQVNAASGGFYTNTLETLAASKMRPRHDGYIAFQSEGSLYLREAIKAKTPAITIARDLTNLFETSDISKRNFA